MLETFVPGLLKCGVLVALNAFCAEFKFNRLPNSELPEDTEIQVQGSGSSKGVEP